MKKATLILLMTFLFPYIVGAQNAVITGTVPDTYNDTEIALFIWDIGGTGEGKIDTIRDGKFRIERELPSPEITMASMSLGQTHKTRYFPLKPGAEINVTIDNPDSYTWQFSSSLPEQAEYDAFIDATKDLMTAYYGLIEQPDEEIQRNSRQRDSILTEISIKNIESLKRLPVSEMWMYVFKEAAQDLKFLNPVPQNIPSDLKKLYETLPEKWKESKLGIQSKAYLYPPEAVKEGDAMADMDFYDLDGNIHHLAEFHGKWLLLDFWSAGCYACIVASPELKLIADKYGDKVEIISLSRDSERLWRLASDRHNISWTNWNDFQGETGAHLKYGVEALPTFILVSPEGIIAEKWTGYGHGSLMKHIRDTVLPKPETVVNLHADTLIVEYPAVEQNTTNGILELEKIVRTPENVTLHFSVLHHPQYWIKIVPESYIQTPDGTQYKVISADGIKPGEEFYTGEDWTAHFSLTFPALPSGTESFDFIESPDWHINGIKIQPQIR